MDTNPIHVHTHDDQEEIAKMFSRYDMLAMPVVDSENRIVGIITIDDAVDVIQDENTEDFEKMAGMTPVIIPTCVHQPLIWQKTVFPGWFF